MRPSAPELKSAFADHDRKVERALRKDRPRLFQALSEFASMYPDADGWAHFRRRWPDLFPADEYDRMTGPMPDVQSSVLVLSLPGSECGGEEGLSPSIQQYPHWLNHIWRGGEPEPYLEIMLGTKPTPKPEDVNPEDAGAIYLRSIPPAVFALDWQTGAIRYQGACDFQRALYLLFRESWRARICERCEAPYIASRESQRYCSTDCSEEMQREVKRKWWAEHGREWREQRSRMQSKKRGKGNGTKKAR